ncbi:MAG: hypothetical protein IKH99_10300 [Prevotella sp.]|nr:hypothetical protein [Prevotella sp.]
MENYSFYVLVIIAVVVAFCIIKKVASCLIKSIVMLAIVAALAYVWYMYYRA